jgi:hypothetical protein
VKSAGQWIAAGGAVAVVALLWPGPAASAAPALGGYEAIATATVVHAEVYDPTIPLPSSPQGDLSVGYTKSNVESGPTTRALASYLWPGVVLGDGFDQLLGVPGTKYPVQANSRYPATNDAPANNAIQLTDGNGMVTSSNGPTTKATVTGLGLAGAGTNLLGGVGTGLNELGGKSSTPTAAKAPKPLPIPAGLATLVTAQHVTSNSTVSVNDTSVTSTAHAAASNISLLGGLISIKGVDVQSQVVSKASTATLTGGATIGAVTIAGHKIAVDDKGVDIAGHGAALPPVSAALTRLLKTLGIELSTLPVTKSSSGSQGQLGAKVLVVTVDTAPLKTALNGPLATILKLLGPDAEQQLAPLISLGPKIVLTIGDAESTASASPGFDGGGGTFPGGPGSSGGGGGATGGGSGTSGSTAGTSGDTGTGADGGNAAGGGSGGTAPASLQPAAYQLPALGAVPRAMILGALAFAGIVGWGLRRAGAFLLGGQRSCAFGLSTGVPDLRKGRP